MSIRPLLLSLLFASKLYGWSCEGHEAVALIAEKHLNPRALAAVMKLLDSQPIDAAVQRYCKESPKDRMAESSTWADDTRKAEQTGSWHYMDLPLGMNHGDIEAYCPPVGPSVNGGPRTGCVLSALRYNLNILHDDKESDAEKARALRYLIHLIGDMHQPLHSTANNDQGGNCVPLRFFSDPKIANLHSVWDTLILSRDMASRGEDAVRLADDLDREYRKQSASWTKHGTEFAKWLWEGHKIAQNVTYGDLRPKLPVESPEEHPDCKAESERNAALHVTIDEDYQRKAVPIVREQIAKAGYRLAEVLDEIWP